MSEIVLAVAAIVAFAVVVVPACEWIARRYTLPSERNRSNHLDDLP